METALPDPGGKAPCGPLALLFLSGLFSDVPVPLEGGTSTLLRSQETPAQRPELPSFGPRAVPRPLGTGGPL